MDEAARKKYCRLLMFDVPSPPHNSKGSLNASEMPLMIDYTTSLENSSIRTQDNFVFTSFVEPMKVKPQTSYTKPISSNEKSYNNTSIPSYNEPVKNDTNNLIIDESFHQQSVKKTPRPPNAFILYRRAKQPLITKEQGNISNAKISKLLAKMWRDETEEEKLHWQKIADRKKMEHMQAHPGYIYRPKKSISNDRRKRRKTSEKKSISTLEKTVKSELSTSTNVNSSPVESSLAVSPWVLYDNSSYDNFHFPYIFPQESTVPYFFLEQPKEMNSEDRIGFFEQSLQHSPYSFIDSIDSPYNNVQQIPLDISQEQMMFANDFIPFNFDPFSNL